MPGSIHQNSIKLKKLNWRLDKSAVEAMRSIQSPAVLKSMALESGKIFLAQDISNHFRVKFVFP